VTAHALRHTAASLAISAGANPKVVQRMLGHASAAMTLGRSEPLVRIELTTARLRGSSAFAGYSSAPAAAAKLTLAR
jgi:integrase